MSEFSDWMPAPNIHDAPDLYEVENGAMDPDGLLLSAMRTIAPWDGKRLVDLGCGTGFWLSSYAGAAEVIGIEPDPQLRAANPAIIAGSAEQLPFADASIDVIHARFAYFFGPGAEAGLAEALRVLAPGGALLVIDNDYASGEFADILQVATEGNGSFDPTAAERWWRAQGAESTAVTSEWRFESRSDLEAVLGNEFRDGAADRWLRAHPDRTWLTYGYRIFTVTRP